MITSAATEYEHGSAADLALNVRIEVEGMIDSNGRLLADEISIRGQSGQEALELEDSITALNPANRELQLAGQTVLVDNSTILLDEVNDTERSIRYEDLQLDDYIEVEGLRLTDGRILALRIDRELPNSEEEGDDD
ncbi:MAG: DUF5666 domain-containing protein [Thiolinea sp.]